jgi:hypothetical protein
VTEWPASEKSNLEVSIGVGAVAVAYSGCAMRVLPHCRLRGAYRWMRTTPATDVIDIKDEDELFAKLPLGAASLEGELKRSGELSVRTTVSGQLKLEGVGPGDVPIDGECATATHLVSALSVGAFSLTAGGALTAKASAEVTAVGSTGGGVERSRKQLRSAGEPDTCKESTMEAAHANCRSPIQVFLQPLPGRAAEEGPAGTVKVDFVSAAANDRWDVYADDAVICTTPCTKWMNPSRPVMLRGRESKLLFMSPDRVNVARLDDSGAHLQLQARGTETTRRRHLRRTLQARPDHARRGRPGRVAGRLAALERAALRPRPAHRPREHRTDSTPAPTGLGSRLRLRDLLDQRYFILRFLTCFGPWDSGGGGASGSGSPTVLRRLPGGQPLRAGSSLATPERVGHASSEFEMPSPSLSSSGQPGRFGSGVPPGGVTGQASSTSGMSSPSSSFSGQPTLKGSGCLPCLTVRH